MFRGYCQVIPDFPEHIFAFNSLKQGLESPLHRKMVSSYLDGSEKLKMSEITTPF